MKKTLLFFCAALIAFSANAFAQTQPVSKTSENKTIVRTAPNSITAKYEGGMFGYGKKEKGTLRLDDANQRLVFYGADTKEKFAIPYKSMVVIYPQSQSVQSTTGRAVGVIPVPGASIAGLFIKEKKRYLVINFDDPNVDTKGLVNFKLENKELLASVLQTIGGKANLQQRDDAYYRPRATNPVTE